MSQDESVSSQAADVELTGTDLAEAEAADDWGRLSGRVVVVDLARTVISLIPAVVALAVTNSEPSWDTMWPFAAIAFFGVTGAVGNTIRWIFTRYRVTDTEVQRRTGIVTRRYRSVRRNRIRSVDTHAKLRHRLGGLRVVEIGAGQQNIAGESAFMLDALSKANAEQLRRDLMHTRQAPPEATAQTSGETDPASASALVDDDEGELLAAMRPWWVIYNMVSVWAFVTAAGLLWGAYWLVGMFSFDLYEWSQHALDWDALGPWSIAIVVAVVGVIGMVGMGFNFFTSYWKFELARVHTSSTSFLRTKRGLFSTREVNRDESRVRGLAISQPVLWRWMGMADTNVITTGLGLWNMEQPASLLPRGPIGVAREVSDHVLGSPNPLAERLERHPIAALRRRLGWATGFAAVLALMIAWPLWTGVAPMWLLWIVFGVWILGLAGAVAAYLALGHAIRGDYVVMSSGMMSRNTSALRRDAVSTIAVSQSVLQRRLGLANVSAMTAAGWFTYVAPDMAADEAFGFAAQTAPGLFDPFVVREP